MFTDKIIFKGTPAQFWAVIQEYILDAGDTTQQVSANLFAPQKEVIVPRLVQKGGDSSDPFSEFMANATYGSSRRETIAEILSDSPRAGINFLSQTSNNSFVAFSITALVRGDGQTVLTLRVSDKEWPDTKERWESIISYMSSLGYLGADETRPLSEPEAWIEELAAADFQRGTPQWWGEIERRVREYWTQRGRKALPIKGRLENVTSYRRQVIYERTSLGDKELTQTDTFTYTSVMDADAAS
jgi:hypothetical protein